jgi:hypothetical protein
MKLDDVENQLRSAKFSHLTEDELDSYHGQKLDTANHARADAHLKLCLICEHRLQLLGEKSTSFDDQEITAEDIAIVKRVMKQMALRQQPSDSKPAEAKTKIQLRDRLNDYLRQIVENWRAHFKLQQAVCGTRAGGEEIWHGQDDGGNLRARAIVEKNAGLTIHFSSNDLSLEGARLNVRLGPVTRVITLHLVSESEVYAKVEIPRRQVPRTLMNISIEDVS